MGKWIKKTAATPITSEAKVIDNLNSYDHVNAVSVAAVKTALEEQYNEIIDDVTAENYVKKYFVNIPNPADFITVRSGDTINRVSLVKNMNTIYFSIVLLLNSDVPANEHFFEFNEQATTDYGLIIPNYDFDVMGVLGATARSFSYNAENKAFMNTYANVSSGQYIRLSAQWAVDE